MVKSKKHVIWLTTLLFIVSVFATIFIPAVMAATQATYYVSPTGSDNNPGTESAPFQTIEKARQVVDGINGSMTGDIYVYLRGGTYNITNTINFGPGDSGSNGYRIYYQAYSGETPVLNGATKVTGWTQYSGSIYKATLNRSTKLRNLYVNDQRANMTSKRVTAQGGSGTYSVTSGQASWAWTSGSKSDGVQYNTSDVPAIANNKDDLEIVNGSTWNENIVCTRDVTTSGNYRVLLMQQPYGAIAQTPPSGANFAPTGSHTIYNAFEFLNSAGQFYFDKTNKILYYYLRSGENISTADVEAPVVEQLINIAGTSTSNRVKNITFQGITFENTDYSLVNVGGSHGKSTCQAANAYIAFTTSDFHSTKYDILDTLPGMISVRSADSIEFIGNTVKHSGADGISMVNDVINSNITGNYITDITSSGITVGHPQHVYIGDNSSHAKYASGVEGICKNDTITNNMLYNISTSPGFGGCAGITAYFVDTLKITYNFIHTTAYNGINLGWGWRNFADSTTCKNNTISYNRLFNTLNRLHDSGAVYTLGQMSGTNINQNYVKGIPPNTSGPTYGLHNDEGSAYITENDNVLDISTGVTYTINCEDYGAKHDLTIRRTYATVNKMGKNPPNSVIDPPVAVPDNVWPVTQYNYCLNSGVQESYRSIIPSSLLSTQDYVFPASCAIQAGSTVNIRSSGNSSNSVWFAPAGTTNFVEGATMTKAAGTATSITAPYTAGTYKLCVVNSSGQKLGESAALLRVSGSAPTPTPNRNTTPTPTPTQGATPTPTPTPIPGTISIAAGRSSAVGSFQADQYYSGGSTYTNTNTVDVSQITSNPPPAALFNNERYGAMSYTIPGFTAGNSYTVTLYFAETYLTSSGSRLFNVSINGATVLSNFDIYASAGGQNKAIARPFTATANSSGQIVLQFISGTENPKINGISIKPGSGTPTPTPTATATPTPTRVVNSPSPSPTGIPTATPTPTPTNSFSISIAAGRTSALGSFQADQYYSGGSTYSNTNTVDVSQITSNPPPAALFNNERYGAMTYTIPGFTTGGSYTVTLYFAETFLTASGKRLFSVSINGSTALSNFDIYTSAGGQNKAIARSFTATANSSGQIVIQFISGTENPKINGISIK